MRAYVTHHIVVHTIRSQFKIIYIVKTHWELYVARAFGRLQQLHLLTKYFRKVAIICIFYILKSLLPWIYYNFQLHVTSTTINSHSSQHTAAPKYQTFINDLRIEASHPCYFYSVKCMRVNIFNICCCFPSSKVLLRLNTVTGNIRAIRPTGSQVLSVFT